MGRSDARGVVLNTKVVSQSLGPGLGAPNFAGAE